MHREQLMRQRNQLLCHCLLGARHRWGCCCTNICSGLDRSRLRSTVPAVAAEVRLRRRPLLLLLLL